MLLLFPLVLAIHNLDEIARHEDFVAAYHARLPAALTSASALWWALTTLTLAAAVLCLSAVLWQNPILLLMAKVSIYALLLNAIGHCLLSVKRRKLLPGTRSAALLVLPYGVLALTVILKDSPVSTVIRHALAGAITIPLAVAVFLLLGNAIARLRPP